jgi:hypothetical protein
LLLLLETVPKKCSNKISRGAKSFLNKISIVDFVSLDELTVKALTPPGYEGALYVEVSTWAINDGDAVDNEREVGGGKGREREAAELEVSRSHGTGSSDLRRLPEAPGRALSPRENDLDVGPLPGQNVNRRRRGNGSLDDD